MFTIIYMIYSTWGKGEGDTLAFAITSIFDLAIILSILDIVKEVYKCHG